MKKTTVIVIVLMVIAVFASTTQAGSIWAKRDKVQKNLYADDTARKIGDVLTVVISETTKIDNKVKRSLEKTTERSVDWDGKIGIDHILPSIPGVNIDTGNGTLQKLDGQADYKDERKFEDKITVVVEDIQPNGNLVVIGTLQRDIAGDKQTIQLGGVVRPSDITFDNTVQSSQIADFYIVMKNKGVSETYNKVGWLGQIFDWLWPF